MMSTAAAPPALPQERDVYLKPRAERQNTYETAVDQAHYDYLQFDILFIHI